MFSSTQRASKVKIMKYSGKIEIEFEVAHAANEEGAREIVITELLDSVLPSVRITSVDETNLKMQEGVPD